MEERHHESGDLRVQAPKRVLYIEDDEYCARAVQRILSGVAQTVLAETLEHGLELLRSDRFDAVFLDLGLPGVSGLDGLSATRAATDAPIIILTGMSPRGEEFASLKERAGAAGADGYIVKGATAFDIRSDLRFILARYYRERALRILHGEIAA